MDAPGVASPRQASPHITLSITGSVTDKAELRIRHPLVLIGQAHECQVRLRDERVSRFHCALVNTTAGLWIVDLLGRGGVALNGALVRTARFDEGDELRIGGTFTIQLQATPPAEEVSPRESAISVAGVSLPSPQPETALSVMTPPTVEPGALVPTESAGSPGPALAETSLALAFARLQQQMAEQFNMTLTRVISAFREVQRDQMKMVWQELARVQQLTDELAAVKDQLHQLRTEPATRSRSLPAAPTPAETPTPVAANDASSKAADAKPPMPKPRKPSERTASTSAQRTDVHEWLSGRVDAIQKERDGRWQKIFSLLSGSSPPAR
jgi:hypothetical protein